MNGDQLLSLSSHKTNDVDNYRLSLPFVQRIINSSLHETAGVIPASMFGNQVNLDRGIRIPVIRNIEKYSALMSKMLCIQIK